MKNQLPGESPILAQLSPNFRKALENPEIRAEFTELILDYQRAKQKLLESQTKYIQFIKKIDEEFEAKEERERDDGCGDRFEIENSSNQLKLLRFESKKKEDIN